MIGKMLAHYEILRSLGRGGMGEVYLARDTKLGREVALKLLPEKLKADPARRARFEREAQTVAALNHPHVVTLHAVEEADGQPFLVMEFIDGETLDEAIGPQGLPLRRLLDLALPLTEAVAAAHARGITHRDLKPGNVMLDREGRLKVLDFGLAKLLAETGPDDQDRTIEATTTREGTIVGTAAYMSPEQAEGKPVDSRSDVFSLGILLYQMATGQKPFQGDTQMSTLTAVLRDDPQPVVAIRPDLPRQLARIVRRCLEKDPGRRYESARGLHYDLEILREELDSGEIEKPAAMAGAPRERSPGGRRWLPWVAAAAVVALVATGWAWRSGRTGGPAAVTGPASPAVARSEVPTVVVFPFENLGAPDDAYFAAGITDEIVTSLTGTEGIRVLSRTSARNYDRTGKTMREIAADLGVDYVLEGSVRWERHEGTDSRVRVTPQLVHATTDEQVWAQRYDRSMDEIFAVQSEIAGEVVRSLGATLGSGGDLAAVEAPTEDIGAYHAYLRAAALINSTSWNQNDWARGIDLLEKALAIDPDFQLAWVMLARAQSGMVHFGWDRSDERLAMAKRAVDRARALAPDAYQTLYAEGNYYYWGLKDYERALAAFREADRLQPGDPEIMQSIAYVMRRQERYAEAVEILVEAAKLSPKDSGVAIHVAETYGMIGKYDEGLRWCDEAITYAPDRAFNYGMAATIAIRAGRREAALAYLDAIPPSVDPEVARQMYSGYLELREYAKALAQAERLPELHEGQYVTSSRYLAMGDVLRAMDRFDEARENYARAVDVFAGLVAEKPESGNRRASYARALAGVGRFDEAVAEIEKSFALFPASKDPWIETWREYDRVDVLIQAGRHEEAVAALAALMQRETDVVSPATLRNSPVFDPLRGREDFEALVSQVS